MNARKHRLDHILVVDDQPDNLLILEDLLGDSHAVQPVSIESEFTAIAAQYNDTERESAT